MDKEKKDISQDNIHNKNRLDEMGQFGQDISHHNEMGQFGQDIGHHNEMGQLGQDISHHNEMGQLGQDISHHNEMGQFNQDANRLDAIGRLTGIVAHEFNNYLTIINGYTQLAIEELAQIEGCDKISEMLEMVGITSQKATNLTKKLLTIAKKHAFQPDFLHLGHFIRKNSNAFNKILGGSIKLNIKIQDESLGILGDPSQMQMIITSLLLNSRNAILSRQNSDIQGNIWLIVKLFKNTGEESRPYFNLPHGSFVHIQISDNGPGFSPAVMDKAFEPFFTNDPTGSHTSLGLAACYGAVKQNSGWIFMGNKDFGGAVIDIFLPQSHLQDNGLPKPSNIPNISGKTILMIDDSAYIRKYINALLTPTQAQIIQAESGEDGLDIFLRKRKEIDLLIVDLILPKMDGLLFYQKISQLRPNIPVLFISAEPKTVLDKANIDLSSSLLLQKPFIPEQLFGKINQMIGLKEGENE